MPAMDKSFRLLDFNIYDNVIEKELSSAPFKKKALSISSSERTASDVTIDRMLCF